MKSNRRSVLIGLGALTVGGGAVFGTGAFSSVDADRSVSVNIADDSDALVGLEAGDSEYVDDEGGLLEIDLGDDTLGEDGGVNRNATLEIPDAFTIINNSESNIDIEFEFEEELGDIEINFDPETSTGIEDQTEVTVTIETEDADDGDDFDGEVTITATPSSE